MNKAVFIVLQVLVAIIIFVLLNNFAVWIMKKETIIDDPTALVKTKLFDGWVETNGFTNKAFNTYNMFASNYRKMPRSINKMGGAQFSYSMWIKLNNTSAKNIANKVLFVQGDNKRYSFSTSVGDKRTNEIDYLIKSPLVKFGDDADTLITEFNTSTNISTTAQVSKVNNRDETVRHNVFSLMPGKWMLMTWIFEDDKKYDEPEDGVVFRFYLNDILYQTQRYSGSLRLNKGDMYILPGGGIEDGFLGDLTYYNYALGVDEIRRVYSQGVTNKRYNEMDTDPSFNEPLYLSQYNKLEIYND